MTHRRGQIACAAGMIMYSERMTRQHGRIGSLPGTTMAGSRHCASWHQGAMRAEHVLDASGASPAQDGRKVSKRHAPCHRFSLSMLFHMPLLVVSIGSLATKHIFVAMGLCISLRTLQIIRLAVLSLSLLSMPVTA